MGLKDRLLDVVAGWFSPSMDHPASGGMTGDTDYDPGDSGEGDGDAATADGTERPADEGDES